ncbi:unnamed protein product [Ilex paraguariensis]|uniref:ent-kaurene synthase n=1 Tax=Ilex paraguariensis TaxID=185542 RepID=A0ABC8S2N0_9AQUA
MSSHSMTTFLLGYSRTFGGSVSCSPTHKPSKLFAGFWSSGAEAKWLEYSIRLQRCNVFKQTEEYTTVFLNGFVGADTEEETLKVSTSNKIKEHVDKIQSMLVSMGEGEISISAYDTAWVALVEDINGGGVPQFPNSLQWIANNQLPDGSWGESNIFSAYDRLISTLACVVALKSWNIHPNRIEKGLSFIKENICKLEDENAEEMLVGFEVGFPSLMEIARKLDIEVPDESPFLQDIYAKRNVKLSRIPKDFMHTGPSTLLHSLEGMQDLEWEKLLKLQSPDGSFLYSPSSTAFALMQTKDENCLRYLNKTVEKFNGGVPHAYPVDIFEHCWVVDRLQRLGISRYFKSEIGECIDYVYRFWTEEGIGWTGNTSVHDLDDTAMSFRLLRWNGYKVSADAFQHFESGGEFFCFARECNQGVTVMFNLYRASQVMFPGEKILEDAKKFSSKFLREKQANNELLDKWIIAKDLPGEKATQVGYALELPWYASLPRVEARFYLEQYGGEDDIWIAKSLYRMPYISNNTYLELAKLDYNNCQALHRQEWNRIQKWYAECNLGQFGLSQRSLLCAYYLAAASVFEPESANVRLAWAKTNTLIATIMSYFDREHTSREQRTAFLHDFRNSSNCSRDAVNNGRNQTGHELVQALLGALHQFTLDALLAHGRDIYHQLYQAWVMWLTKWQEEGEGQGEAELLVRTINLCAGRWVSQERLPHFEYYCLSEISNRVCHQLRQYQDCKVCASKYVAIHCLA